MSDFSRSKRMVGKGLGYCVINSTFASLFAIATFTLSRQDCYTIKGSNTPVDLATHPDATHVKSFFNAACLLGFVFYVAAAVSSLGYLAKGGPILQMASLLEKVSRLLSYTVFIAAHIMRFSHAGSVCSGDYLTADARADPNLTGYMIPTGRFFMFYIILGWCLVPAMLIILVCIKGDKWAAIALDAPK